MRTLKIIWGTVSAMGFVIDLLVVVPTFLQMYFGVEPSAFFGWFVTNAGWLLPLSSTALGAGAGALVGWNVRNGQATKEREAIGAEVARLEKLPEEVLGMTLEEAASRLGPKITAHNFEGLSDQCKHLLLFAYGQENGFIRPTSTDFFPDGDNCLSILHARHLLVKIPKQENWLAAQSWAINRDARRFLRSDEKLLAALEEGRARNREAGGKRREKRLLERWERAGIIHRLVVLKELAEKDNETHDGFNVRPAYELHNSQLVEEKKIEGNYFYELQGGVADLFDAHPELYDEFGENAKDADWISDKIASLYNNQDDDD